MYGHWLCVAMMIDATGVDMPTASSKEGATSRSWRRSGDLTRGPQGARPAGRCADSKAKAMGRYAVTISTPPGFAHSEALAQLAEKIGIAANVLESTVRDFNGHAREGKDPTFGKGSKAYNRYQGDALHSPNPCLAPLEHGPFYAIKLVVGDLGTYAGLITDQYSRVLDGAQTPISGLYAVGNDIASIMGGNYPGAGITLGPALTFGHIAGCHIAGVQTGPSSDNSHDCKTGSASGPSVEDDGTVVMGEVA